MKGRERGWWGRGRVTNETQEVDGEQGSRVEGEEEGLIDPHVVEDELDKLT